MTEVIINNMKETTVEKVAEVPPQDRTYQERAKQIRPVSQWDEIGKRLKAEPYEWFDLGDRDRSLVTHIKTGRYVAFRPAGAFEATSRTSSTAGPSRNAGRVYARYVGGVRESDLLPIRIRRT